MQTVIIPLRHIVQLLRKSLKKRAVMKNFALAGLTLLVFASSAVANGVTVSEETETCLECHATLHPGIVQEWMKSRHAKVTPAEGLKREKLKRRISVEQVSDKVANVSVGCAECHTMNAKKHKDTFEHADYQVHIVVTPEDCATCHSVEVAQYGKNVMSYARTNLVENPLYASLMNEVNGIHGLQGEETTLAPPDAKTNADACLFCHGTKVEVKGAQTVESDMGDMEIPVLTGWPNQGVGRLNPDGSMGSCAACHTRHQFSIEMARKPHTCSECHKGPDVPAYPVYMVSKMGNIYSAHNEGWNFDGVPWKVGRDFTAPTCATCHVSLLVGADNGVIAERTHQMNNRIAWRLFGIIYAHAHPKSPNTSIIRNNSGLPLATELTGEPASKYLIDAEEQAERRRTMQAICHSCHGDGWVNGHFDRLENTIKTTNEMTLTATKIMFSAWEKGVAKGLKQNDSIFNEAIERKWMEQWLFYANSTRLASAMAGADYGVFANGRWYLSKNIHEMLDWLHFKLKEK
jgi:hydroxylamine dehydrogenase